MIIKSLIAKLYFFVAFFLIFTDIMLLIFSGEYRNMLGMINRDDVGGYIFRILPSFVMLFLYTYICRSILNGYTLSKKFLIFHSVFFVIAGTISCLPWIGMFAAIFTPIASLYLSLVLWSKDGYIVSIFIASIFLAFNIRFIFITNRQDL